MFVPTISPQSEKKYEETFRVRDPTGALLIPNLQRRVQTPRHGPEPGENEIPVIQAWDLV